MCAVATVLILAIPRLGIAQSIDVKEAWLKRNCLDKGTGDHPISSKEFEACVRKLIEPLPPLDKNRREFFGEQYNPPKYVECRTQPGNRNNSACNIYILRRREWPEHWPNGAKRIKWPEAPTKSVYRKGMTSKEYWEALCKAEAGEIIYRTVKDVESVYNARPRSPATDYELSDRYVLEDPFTYTDVIRSPNPEEYFVQPYLGKYRVYEQSNETNDGRFTQYLRSDSATGPPYQTNLEGKWVRVPYIVAKKSANTVTARYAISWRGIARHGCGTN